MSIVINLTARREACEIGRKEMRAEYVPLPATLAEWPDRSPESLFDRLNIVNRREPDGCVVWLVTLANRQFTAADVIGVYPTQEAAQEGCVWFLMGGDA